MATPELNGIAGIGHNTAVTAHSTTRQQGASIAYTHQNAGCMTAFKAIPKHLQHFFSSLCRTNAGRTQNAGAPAQHDISLSAIHVPNEENNPNRTSQKTTASVPTTHPAEQSSNDDIDLVDDAALYRMSASSSAVLQPRNRVSTHSILTHRTSKSVEVALDDPVEAHHAPSQQDKPDATKAKPEGWQRPGQAPSSAHQSGHRQTQHQTQQATANTFRSQWARGSFARGDLAAFPNELLQHIFEFMSVDEQRRFLKATNPTSSTRLEALSFLTSPDARDAILRTDPQTRARNLVVTGLHWVSEDRLAIHMEGLIEQLPELNAWPQLQQGVVSHLKAAFQRIPDQHVDSTLVALIRNWPALSGAPTETHNMILEIAQKALLRLDDWAAGDTLDTFLRKSIQISATKPEVGKRAFRIALKVLPNIDQLGVRSLWDSLLLRMLRPMPISAQQIGNVLGPTLQRLDPDARLMRLRYLLPHLPLLQRECPESVNEILNTIETTITDNDIPEIGVALGQLMNALPTILLDAPELQNRLSRLAQQALDKYCPGDGPARLRYGERIRMLRS